VPDVGDTENKPDVGGALVTTTTEAELNTPSLDGNEQVNVNVSVAPIGSVFGESTKNNDETADVNVSLVGITEATAKLRNLSSTDHKACPVLMESGRETVAVSTSFVEGFIFEATTFETRDTMGKDAPMTLTVTTSWLDRAPVESCTTKSSWLDVPNELGGANN